MVPKGLDTRTGPRFGAPYGEARFGLDAQLSLGEAMALDQIDHALLPTEADGIHLARARARFDPKPADALRLPPPNIARSRSQAELQQRLFDLLQRAEAPEADPPVARMLDAIRELICAQLQIEAARHGGRYAPTR